MQAIKTQVPATEFSPLKPHHHISAEREVVKTVPPLQSRIFSNDARLLLHLALYNLWTWAFVWHTCVQPRCSDSRHVSLTSTLLLGAVCEALHGGYKMARSPRRRFLSLHLTCSPNPCTTVDHHWRSQRMACPLRSQSLDHFSLLSLHSSQEVNQSHCWGGDAIVGPAEVLEMTHLSLFTCLNTHKYNFKGYTLYDKKICTTENAFCLLKTVQLNQGVEYFEHFGECKEYEDINPTQLLVLFRQCQIFRLQH